MNLLEPVKLTVWKVIMERITYSIVKFRIDDEGDNMVLADLKSRYGRI